MIASKKIVHKSEVLLSLLLLLLPALRGLNYTCTLGGTIRVLVLALVRVILEWNYTCTLSGTILVPVALVERLSAFFSFFSALLFAASISRFKSGFWGLFFFVAIVRHVGLPFISNCARSCASSSN